MAKEKAKKLSKKIIFAIVCGAIIGAILIAALGLQIAFVIADKIECWHPSYDRLDEDEMRGILESGELSDEDYNVLYRQTGLTKTGIDRALENGDYGIRRILEIQDDFFTPHKVKNGYFAPYVCTDYIEKNIANIFVKKGDVIVTSSTHISSVRIGHAGLVTDDYGEVIQANAYGTYSRLSYVDDYTNRVNFMIFSPDVDEEIKGEVVDYAKTNLLDIPYEGLAGLLTDKNKIDKTQCAHLVWYAYKQFGIDLDSDGGLLVTPKDLANSPKMKLVQVFGFDIDKLWK